MTRKQRRIIIGIVTAVTVAAAGLGGWWAYTLWRDRDTALDVKIDRSQFPVCGIDVSHHNGPIDFESVSRDNVDFVYIKATDGVGDVDERFERNFIDAKRAGLKVGVYHFFRYHRGGRQQAETLLHAIKGLDADLPLAIDLEDDSNRSGHEEDIVPRLRTMIHALRDAGYRVIIYANQNQYEDYIRNNFNDVELWLASSRAPSNDYDPRTIWQYSHRGRVDGIYGNVDLNAFVGSRSKFDSWARGARK